jgi:3-methyladenine DNA glycosylase AlkD
VTAHRLKQELSGIADAETAAHLQRYFKTGPGEYGEGDIFVGVRVPAIRRVARRFRGLDEGDIDALLDSPVHEHRFAALQLLVWRYPSEPERVVGQYLAAMQRGRINNWDLVDSSAEYILGPWLFDRDRSLVTALAASDDVWERRIAIITTFGFIRRGDASTTVEIARLLIDDDHDLIHKAVGWMLREVGKRVDAGILTEFLEENAHRMPRTMLSYAIEHLDPAERARLRAL